MNYSSDVVADAVREYWKTCYPRTVMAFFYQKYEYDNEWEWCEELAECNASDDYETVIFQNDFCEGQTCVKNISIVSLDDIVEYYIKNHISSMSDLISRQAAIDADGLDEEIRCEMCRNQMKTRRGCDGNCKYDEKLYERIMQILDKRIKTLPSSQPEIVRCKDCKHHWTHSCMDAMPREICDLDQTFYDARVDFCSLAERRTDESND